MKTCIDSYGNRLDKAHPGYLSAGFGRKEPYLVEELDNGVSYTCFSANLDANQPIHRITESNGTTEMLWAYGKWADRATLTYTLELSKPLIIEVY